MERVDPVVARWFVAAMVEQSYPGNPFPSPELYTAENIARIRDAVVAGAGLKQEGG